MQTFGFVRMFYLHSTIQRSNSNTDDTGKCMKHAHCILWITLPGSV